MALTKITEPTGNINLYTDYAFEYNSNVYDLINFKYKIEYLEQQNTKVTFYNDYYSGGAYFGTGATGNLISSNVFTGLTLQTGDIVQVFNTNLADGSWSVISASSPSVVIVSGNTFSGFTSSNPYFIITGYRDLWNTIDTFERFPQPDTNIKFDLKKYISSGIDSDYFEANYMKAKKIGAILTVVFFLFIFSTL